MRFAQTCLASTILIACASATQAQQPRPGYDFNGYPGGYAGSGVGGGVYGVSIGGFGNYELPGKGPGYNGNGLLGYGPAASVDSYFGYPGPVSNKPEKARAATNKPSPPVRKPEATKKGAKAGEARRAPSR